MSFLTDISQALGGIPFIGSAISAAGQYFGQQSANEQSYASAMQTAGANAAEAQRNRAFNEHQANVARDFNSAEAERARTWSADQARTNREFEERMAANAQLFNWGEAQTARNIQESQYQRSQAFASGEADKARLFNAGEAEKARLWSQNMSNTAYQRATADMRAAGINPMLAYMQGGASTPSGASASAGMASAPGGGGIASASGVKASGSLPGAASASAGAAHAGGGNIAQQMTFRNTLEAAVNSAVEWARSDPMIKGLWQDLETKRELTRRARHDADTAAVDTELRKHDVDYRSKQTRTEVIRGSKMDAERQHVEYDLPRAQVDKDVYESTAGKAARWVGRFGHETGQVFNSAKGVSDAIRGWVPDIGSSEWDRSDPDSSKGKWRRGKW